MMAFMARLKCLVSHCSELNVVTFILVKFSWVLKTHFPSSWNVFNCSSVLLSSNSRYSNFPKSGITDCIASTEGLKSCSFGKRSWRQFESTSATVVTGTVLPFHCIHSVHSVLGIRYSVLHKGPYNCKYIVVVAFCNDTVSTECSQQSVLLKLPCCSS
jgi:hypothetical protein